MPGFIEQVDVRDPDLVQHFTAKVIRKLGRIDAWINNAAIMDVFDVADGGPDRWRQMLDTNVVGVVNGCRSFIQHVRTRPSGGVLVNVTAGSARQARHGWGAYSAGKAAIERITEAIAAEESSTGLRAFCVSPGPMNTEMQRALWDLPEETFPEARLFRERAAKGQISDPRHVAVRIAEKTRALLRPHADIPEPVLTLLPGA